MKLVEKFNGVWVVFSKNVYFKIRKVIVLFYILWDFSVGAGVVGIVGVGRLVLDVIC